MLNHDDDDEVSGSAAQRLRRDSVIEERGSRINSHRHVRDSPQARESDPRHRCREIAWIVKLYDTEFPDYGKGVSITEKCNGNTMALTTPVCGSHGLNLDYIPSHLMSDCVDVDASLLVPCSEEGVLSPPREDRMVSEKCIPGDQYTKHANKITSHKSQRNRREIALLAIIRKEMSKIRSAGRVRIRIRRVHSMVILENDNGILPGMATKSDPSGTRVQVVYLGDLKRKVFCEIGK